MTAATGMRPLLLALTSFLVGLYCGIQLMGNSFAASQSTVSSNDMNQKAKLSLELNNNKLLSCLKEVKSLKSALVLLQNESQRKNLTLEQQPRSIDQGGSRFGSKVARLATGTVRVPTDEFMNVFDYGIPPQLQKQISSSEVLVLYPNKNTLPSDNQTAFAAAYNDGNSIPLTSVEQATSNCNDLNVVYIKEEGTEKLERCLAVVAGPGAHHILRWRKDGESSKFERVGLRGEKGRFVGVPNEKAEKLHRVRMKMFLANVDVVLEDLKPVVSRIAKDQTVVVMTCNMGYLTMLMNFVCSARARGIDLSNLLVFATDKESFDLTQQLGLTAFHTDKVFGEMPTEMAEGFGDKTFGHMTYAQMLSVLLVNMLGFDVLFQNCDIVWYKNPLRLFSNDTVELQDYDIMFMDDGNLGWEFVPFRGNTGLFYVRHNDRTRYLFTDFLFSGDLAATVQVDQIVMSSLLNHHSTFHGLKVKTMDWHLLPGGREFHQEEDFVNSLIDDSQKAESDAVAPWTFHMHWTYNRTNKVDYMRQSGMWYVHDKCMDKKAHEIVRSETNEVSMSERCCASAPLISCHHADKPSVKSCRK